MEVIEIASWLTLDAIKKVATIIETIGDLQTGHWQSIFCFIENDYLELGYLDTESNYLRRYEDKEEFDLAIEKKMGEEDETPYANEESEESFKETEEADYNNEDPIDVDIPEDEENVT